MKTHQSVSSQRRKSRKAYFTAPSNVRRVMMSCHLSQELKQKYEVRSIPVRKGDQVKVMVGGFKNNEGKVTSVYRRRRCIYIEKVIKEKTNGQQANIPVHPSNCMITYLKMDRDRREILEKKKRSKASKDKHKQINKMD